MSLPSKLITIPRLPLYRHQKVRLMGRCLDYDIDTALLVLEHRSQTCRVDVSSLLPTGVKVEIGRYYHVIGTPADDDTVAATLLWHAGNLTDADLDAYDRAVRGRARLKV